MDDAILYWSQNVYSWGNYSVKWPQKIAVMENVFLSSYAILSVEILNDVTIELPPIVTRKGHLIGLHLSLDLAIRHAYQQYYVVLLLM